MNVRPTLLSLGVLALGSIASCARPGADTDAPAASPTPDESAVAANQLPFCDPAGSEELGDFERSPGGVSEVSAQWLAKHHCRVRVIDVRERDELVGELGHVEGVEWLPLRDLAREAETWDPKEPVVLVCRSGRRSGRAALYLESLGFSEVASVTGGMIAWHARELPVSRKFDVVPAGQVTERRQQGTAHDPKGEQKRLTQADIEIHIGDPTKVRWVKAASLMLHGSESCVDGRDGHAVIGTPGGDAGEFLLALAAAEQVIGHALPDAEVPKLFDSYLESFGHFYMHTDAHAVDHLAKALAADERFAAHREKLEDPEQFEFFLRHPPRKLEKPLLEYLVQADNIGCGHIKLMTEFPDEYTVRPDLTALFLRTFFQRMWQGDPVIDYVVLDGDHAEGAVVNVTMDDEVYPYTLVPMLAPHHAGSEMFVNHPQVASWMRKQNARFLTHQEEWLKDHDVTVEQFLAEIERLGHEQLAATVQHLASDLPVFEVRFHKRELEVVESGG